MFTSHTSYRSVPCLAALAAAALACNLIPAQQPRPGPSQEPGPLAASPQPSATPIEPAGPTTQAPTDAHGAGADLPAEAIMILEPGPGSRLTSPLRVAGIADPAFEQTLGVRLVLDDGTELASGPLMIDADLGARGPFEGELSFSLSSERNALLQVYDQSARDGGITHLASVGVTLAPGGPVEVTPAEALPESLHIVEPVRGASISGGSVHLEGIGLASFEGTLVVEIYDADGSLVGAQPLIVAAPDIGLPGRFSIQVEYSVASEGPGRIVVMDPLPAFNGIGHIASIEVTLFP